MTKIRVIKKDEKIVNIEISGHTGYEDFGKDIVCASISSIVTTTVNAIIRIDNKSINYETKDGFINIEVLSTNKHIDILLDNMIDLLKQLTIEYPKNVKINV